MRICIDVRANARKLQRLLQLRNQLGEQREVRGEDAVGGQLQHGVVVALVQTTDRGFLRSSLRRALLPNRCPPTEKAGLSDGSPTHLSGSPEHSASSGVAPSVGVPSIPVTSLTSAADRNSPDRTSAGADVTVSANAVVGVEDGRESHVAEFPSVVAATRAGSQGDHKTTNQDSAHEAREYR